MGGRVGEGERTNGRPRRGERAAAGPLRPGRGPGRRWGRGAGLTTCQIHFGTNEVTRLRGPERPPLHPPPGPASGPASGPRARPAASSSCRRGGGAGGRDTCLRARRRLSRQPDAALRSRGRRRAAPRSSGGTGTRPRSPRLRKPPPTHYLARKDPRAAEGSSWPPPPPRGGPGVPARVFPVPVPMAAASRRGRRSEASASREGGTRAPRRAPAALRPRLPCLPAGRAPAAPYLLLSRSPKWVLTRKLCRGNTYSCVDSLRRYSSVHTGLGLFLKVDSKCNVLIFATWLFKLC